MAIYENGNNGIGSMRFDDNTILEVKQPGGGGSGVGGPMGLNARNLITGEDTGEVIAAQNEQIAEQGEEIDTLTEQNTELQAENVRLQDANAELTERLAGYAQYEPAILHMNIVNNTSDSIYVPNIMTGSGSISGRAYSMGVQKLDVGGNVNFWPSLLFDDNENVTRRGANIQSMPYYLADGTQRYLAYSSSNTTIMGAEANKISLSAGAIKINELPAAASKIYQATITITIS